MSVSDTSERKRKKRVVKAEFFVLEELGDQSYLSPFNEPVLCHMT